MSNAEPNDRPEATELTKKDVQSAFEELLPAPKPEQSPADKERARRLERLRGAMVSVTQNLLDLGVADSPDLTSAAATAKHLRSAEALAHAAIAALPDKVLLNGTTTATAEKPKRRRRTQAQIAADKAAAEQVQVEEAAVGTTPETATELVAPEPEVEPAQDNAEVNPPAAAERTEKTEKTPDEVIATAQAILADENSSDGAKKSAQAAMDRALKKKRDERPAPTDPTDDVTEGDGF